MIFEKLSQARWLTHRLGLGDDLLPKSHVEFITDCGGYAMVTRSGTTSEVITNIIEESGYKGKTVIIHVAPIKVGQSRNFELNHHPRIL